MSGDGAIKSNRPPSGNTDSGSQRNLIVEFAAALPDGNSLTTEALPRGFPFLIDDDTHEVVEPALLFLVDAYLTKTGVWNRNTTKRAAYDLMDWWRFLDHQGQPWDLANGADLDVYRDSMVGQISSRTHEEYKPETIRARRSLVRRFYAWAQKKGFCDGNLQEATEIREAYLPADRDPLGHVHSGERCIAVDPGTSLARLLESSEGSNTVDAAIAAGERNGAILRVSGGWRAPGAALLEENAAAKLGRMLDRGYPSPVRIPPPDQLAQLVDRLADPSRPLHEEQRSAVLKVMEHAIARLQGGAGVGKTYTLKIVCDLYENLGGRVLLGALAGKAALRLARSTGRHAFTVARIIGQLTERERIESALRDPGLDAAPTAAKFSERLKSLIKIDDRTLVVLDEASMIDLPTLHAILRYMPEGARLLLAGDAAQLVCTAMKTPPPDAVPAPDADYRS
jgi:hypothetical protein